jgi:hypothetical protein
MSYSAGVWPSARRVARSPRSVCGVAVGPRITVRSRPFLGSRTRSASRPASRMTFAPAQLEDLPNAHAGLAQQEEDQPIGLRCPGDRCIERALLMLLTNGPRETTPATHRSAVGERIAAA